MPVLARKGRGAVTNPPVRFDRTRTEAWDDGWGTLCLLYTSDAADE